jgi:hypothetical protein
MCKFIEAESGTMARRGFRQGWRRNRGSLLTILMGKHD